MELRAVSRPAAEPTRLRPRDVIGAAVAAIAARPLRSVRTAMGTAVAVAGFVAVLGIASTAAGQIALAFDQRLATEVRVTAPHSGQATAGDPFPPDVERRLDALHGVVAAGLYWRLAISKPVLVPVRQAGARLGGRSPAGLPASGTSPSPGGTAPAGTTPAGTTPAGPAPGGTTPAGTSPELFAATPGFLAAAGVQVGQGRLFG